MNVKTAIEFINASSYKDIRIFFFRLLCAISISKWIFPVTLNNKPFTKSQSQGKCISYKFLPHRRF